MVYVALRKCLLLALESAAAAGVHIRHIIHKVFEDYLIFI